MWLIAYLQKQPHVDVAYILTTLSAAPEIQSANQQEGHKDGK
jgi:hypothetical protein